MELIGVRLPDELKKKLERIAEKEHRPLSNLVRLIIVQWLQKYEEEEK
jgi:predicted transcriptional regulator